MASLRGGVVGKAMLGVVLALALLASACSSDSADETTTTASAPATTTTAAAPTTGAPTTEAPTTTAGGGAINIANFTFNPGNITVAVGTTLTWTNGDGPSHTTTSDEEGWDSGVLASGDSFELVFDTPGVFTYHCSIHPSMSATVTVEG
jgi:plastocyanin